MPPLKVAQHRGKLTKQPKLVKRSPKESPIVKPKAALNETNLASQISDAEVTVKPAVVPTPPLLVANPATNHLVSDKKRTKLDKPVKGPTKRLRQSIRDLDNASLEDLEICKSMPSHYIMYLYSHPRNVDIDTLPFRRKQCIDREKIINPGNADIVRLQKCDKRLECIELRSRCKVHLGQLKGNDKMINGLPRRRLTIAGPSFRHISMAIDMLEQSFPRIMSTALYPYRMPPKSSTKYPSGNRMGTINTYVPLREPGNIGLRSTFDDRPISHNKLFASLCCKQKQIKEKLTNQ